ncbi:PQQ-dependent sugar dehydrogenase [Clavibacter phaseoli]|nr:PQQ-dependent sugar dehydrogenase [Clavibacter phaseoli]
MRERPPLVQCITNAVVTGFTANVLLALGAAPAMTDVPTEAGPFARIASGLLVNLGTPHAEQREAAVEAAHAAREAGTQLYAYFTSSTDNRIVRMDVTGEPGSLGLGAAEDVVTGIPRDTTHNGGRIAFGPDGMLYATTGDANLRDAAQDPISLAGKILRLTPDGQGPEDNPTPGSPVYSMGHRNPQGIAWDAEGNLWAAEFGQDTWDELNLIEPGGNYGWPVVEGATDDAADDAYIDPVRQWATDDASPSGIAITGDTIFMAGLGGQRLWVIRPGAVVTDPIPDDRVTEFYTREFGRIRDVQAAPDGSLRMLTGNTDGRGTPRAGDDKLLRVELMPIQAG